MRENPELLQYQNMQESQDSGHQPEEITQPSEMREEQEQPEKIMERAKNRQTELLKKIFLSRAIKFGNSEKLQIFLKWLNNVPYVGDANLWKGGISGKEAGKKLSPGERFNYLAAAGMSALSLISLYEGHETAALIEQGLAYVFVNIDTIPFTLKKSAKGLETKAPKLAHMMDATADYIMQKRENFVELGKSLADSSLTTLNLAGNEE